MACTALNHAVRLRTAASTNPGGNARAAGYVGCEGASTDWVSGRELIAALRSPNGNAEMDNVVGVTYLKPNRNHPSPPAPFSGIVFEVIMIDPATTFEAENGVPISRSAPDNFTENLPVDWDAVTLFPQGIQTKHRVLRNCWYRITVPDLEPLIADGTDTRFADVIIST